MVNINTPKTKKTHGKDNNWTADIPNTVIDMHWYAIICVG